MPGRRRDDDFDQRLEMEIIVDAKPEEQAIGWYYYLEEQLRFKARCIAERATSPLRIGEIVEVRGMPAYEVCEHEMFVSIAWQQRMLAVPLSRYRLFRYKNLLTVAHMAPTTSIEWTLALSRDLQPIRAGYAGGAESVRQCSCAFGRPAVATYSRSGRRGIEVPWV
jgi:hypothetical protein